MENNFKFNLINVILSIVLLVITIMQIYLTFFRENHDLIINVNKLITSNDDKNCEIIFINKGNMSEAILGIDLIVGEKVFWKNLIENSVILKPSDVLKQKVQILVDENINNYKINEIDKEKNYLDCSLRYKFINKSGKIDSSEQKLGIIVKRYDKYYINNFSQNGIYNLIN